MFQLSAKLPLLELIRLNLIDSWGGLIQEVEKSGLNLIK